MEQIKVKYFSKDGYRLKQINKGNWIDLAVDDCILCRNEVSCIKSAMKLLHFPDCITTRLEFDIGDIIVVGFGISMQLPENKEALISVRSSLFRDTGLILTNSIGIIDESYNGDRDEWKAVFYATRNGKIDRGQRICQFKIVDRMPPVDFIEVDSLGNDDRGGFGSTGKD